MAVFRNATTGKLSVGLKTLLAPSGTIDTTNKPANVLAAIKDAFDSGKMTLVSGIPFFNGVMPEFVKGTSTGLAAANTTPARNVFTYETDSGKVKVGNGTTAYNSLPYLVITNSSDGSAVYELTSETLLDTFIQLQTAEGHANATASGLGDLEDLVGEIPANAATTLTTFGAVVGDLVTKTDELGTFPTGAATTLTTYGAVIDDLITRIEAIENA